MIAFLLSASPPARISSSAIQTPNCCILETLIFRFFFIHLDLQVFLASILFLLLRNVRSGYTGFGDCTSGWSEKSSFGGKFLNFSRKRFPDVICFLSRHSRFHLDSRHVRIIFVYLHVDTPMYLTLYSYVFTRIYVYVSYTYDYRIRTHMHASMNVFLCMYLCILLLLYKASIFLLYGQQAC